LGDGIALAQGAIETIGGGLAALGGGTEAVLTSPAAVTGVGAVLPVAGVGIAVAGGAVSAHGVAVASAAAKGMSGGSSSGRPKAPIGDDGHPIELHHEGQNPEGPVKEMTRTDHRLNGNFKKNHSNTGQNPSKIDRAKFRTFKDRYWRNKQNK
jgi:hypothetical protein